MDLWSELDALRARHDVLGHPFYVRWSAGELTPAELSRYAGQYRHAVVALARAAEQAAASVAEAGPVQLREELEEHAREEREHIALWDEFCEALGCKAPQPANAETLLCSRTWSGDRERPLLHSLMALHTIEVGQPTVSATKRRGLAEHYGFGDGPATSYFELHETRDLEHAAHSRALIQRTMQDTAGDVGVGGRATLLTEAERASPLTEAERASLLAEAEAVLRANWLLLDGVERRTRALAAA